MTLPLVLHGGTIWTFARAPDPSPVEALLIREGIIALAGRERDVRAAAGARYDDVDLRGDVVLPAFVDAHIHLLAWAAALRAVDVSPRAAPTLNALLAAIGERASRTPPGQWLRASGYRESELAERRQPTRWDLDRVAPYNPLRLDHGSGHAVVLNSAAMAAVGLGGSTEEPAGAEIGRRLDDGEPNGLLLEMGDWLEGRIPPMDAGDLRAGVVEAGRRLVAAGIGAVHDLGARNDLAISRLLAGFARDGALPLSVTVAVGFGAFSRGERPAPGGIVKLMINDIGAEPLPPLADLVAAIEAIAQTGMIAAVHCVTAAAVEHAVTAFEQARGQFGAITHRLEHAAVCPPQLAARIAGLPLTVVLNPALICSDGDRYLREVRPASLPWLHNPATLWAAGVRVAVGSDAPVAAPSPLAGMAAMLRRQTETRQAVPGATTSLVVAVAAHTAFAADAARATAARGRLIAGSAADLVTLPRGWDRLDHCGATAVPRTMLGGRWQTN
jgi:predicted amidohydrolase YtcJ